MVSIPNHSLSATCVQGPTCGDLFRLFMAEYYTKIEQSRKQLLCDKINEIKIKLCEDCIITSRQFDYLTANIKDKDRNFYLLPKIHKPKDKWPNVDMPEGRPTVGDCATESSFHLTLFTVMWSVIIEFFIFFRIFWINWVKRHWITVKVSQRRSGLLLQIFCDLP